MDTIPSPPIFTFLETGAKRIFAGAVDWPGLYGQGRDECSALQSLLAYAPRYQQVTLAASLDFPRPTAVNELQVVERLPGNATTDFGAPDIPPTADTQTMDEPALAPALALLSASWSTLHRTYQAAIGKELRKGPRGGGRELTEIINHVLGAHDSYLRRIHWKTKRDSPESVDAAIRQMAQETTDALTAAVIQGLPERGVRGGAIWKPRTFVRRAAWHILDHIWEIEDRQG